MSKMTGHDKGLFKKMKNAESDHERTQRVKESTSTFDVDSTRVSTICFPMVPLRTLPKESS